MWLDAVLNRRVWWYGHRFPDQPDDAAVTHVPRARCAAACCASARFASRIPTSGVSPKNEHLRAKSETSSMLIGRICSQATISQESDLDYRGPYQRMISQV